MARFSGLRVIHRGMVDDKKQIKKCTVYHGIPMARFSGLPCNSLWHGR